MFASPYALDYFDKTNNTKAVVLAYQDKVEAQQSAAKAIMGKLKFGGKLPVNVNEHYKLGQGIFLNPYVSQSKMMQGFIDNIYTRKN